MYEYLSIYLSIYIYIYIYLYIYICVCVFVYIYIYIYTYIIFYRRLQREDRVVDIAAHGLLVEPRGHAQLRQAPEHPLHLI